MRFTVVWAPEADAQFIDLYVVAPDRSTLTDSSNRIESELRTDPESKGVAFSGNYTRLLRRPPRCALPRRAR